MSNQLTDGICEKIIKDTSLEALGVYAMVKYLQSNADSKHIYDSILKANTLKPGDDDIDSLIIELIQYGYLDIKAV